MNNLAEKNGSFSVFLYTLVTFIFWRIMKLIRKIFLWFIGLFFGITLFFVVLYKYVPVYVTPLMVIRSCNAIFDGKKPVNHKTWVPIEQISPQLVRAVIASEDNLFAKHNGFAWKQIQKARKEAAQGKRVRGASTISQQTAKNVFLPHHKSYIRKALEAYFTVLIEWIWGKERIMEVYLNVIEMGDGIYGAEAAAKYHFGTTAAQLTAAQSARIAACLPNPRRFNAGNPSPYILKRQQQIMVLMPKMGKIELE